MKTCCNGNCNQGRTCPERKAVRWPMLCTRCGSTSHYAEDCKRMPILQRIVKHDAFTAAMMFLCLFAAMFAVELVVLVLDFIVELF